MGTYPANPPVRGPFSDGWETGWNIRMGFINTAFNPYPKGSVSSRLWKQGFDEGAKPRTGSLVISEEYKYMRGIQ